MHKKYVINIFTFDSSLLFLGVTLPKNTVFNGKESI